MYERMRLDAFLSDRVNNGMINILQSHKQSRIARLKARQHTVDILQRQSTVANLQERHRIYIACQRTASGGRKITIVYGQRGDWFRSASPWSLMVRRWLYRWDILYGGRTTSRR